MIHVNDLSGPLPMNLTNLGDPYYGLHFFWNGNNAGTPEVLCSPRHSDFQNWLKGLRKNQGGPKCSPGKYQYVSLLLVPSEIAEGEVSEVKATQDVSGETPVTVAITADLLTPGEDDEVYTLSGNRTLTIAAGDLESSGEPVTITAKQNNIHERNKTVEITGSVSGGGAEPPDAVILTIRDGRPPPTATLQVSPASVLEGHPASVAASLNSVSSHETRITVRLEPQSPASESDYRLETTSPILTIPAGRRFSRETLKIRTIVEEGLSPTKKILVSGEARNNAGVEDPEPKSLTILDKDGAIATLHLSENPISEYGGRTTVRATLDKAASADTRIQVHARSDVASSYVLSPNRTLTIAAGAMESTGLVMITAVDNDVDEPEANVVWVSGSSTGPVAGPNPVQLTILDDDQTPTATLHLSDNPISENGGTTTVTATLDSPSSAETTIRIQATSEDLDLFELSRDPVLRIASGETQSTGQVTIHAEDNTIYGPNAPVTVSGDAANGVGIHPPEDQTLTITDDDAPIVKLVLSRDRILEKDGRAVVHVELEDPTQEAIQIQIQATPRPPAMSSDYEFLVDEVVTLRPSLTIAAGQRRSRGTVTIQAVDNTVYGPAQKRVLIAGSVPFPINSPEPVPLTILDDEEVPTVRLVLSPAAIQEDAGRTEVTAMLSHATSSALPVQVTVLPLPSVYTLHAPSPLVIAAGDVQSTGLVTITAVDNAVDAPDRMVRVGATVLNASEIGNPPPETLTILDDDQTPTATLHLSANPISENGGRSSVTATLSHPSSAHTTITLSALPRDPLVYRLGVNRTLTIAAGETQGPGQVTVTAVDNTVYGPDQTVTLSGQVTNARGIADPAPVHLQILNDELEPLALSIHDTEVIEGQPSARLEVTLNRPADQVVTVQYETVSGTADAPSDYTASRGLVVFAAQSTRGFIPVSITDDADVEDQEVFTVRLSGARGASLRRPEGTVTIVDDDEQASLIIREGDLAEGLVRFVVALSSASREWVSVGYRTVDGTAKAGEDYAASRGVLRFAPGMVEAVVAVPLLGSAMDWEEATFSMHLETPSHAQIQQSVAVATIRPVRSSVEQVLSAYAARFVRASSVELVEALRARMRTDAEGSACGAVARAELLQLWRRFERLHPGELLAGCHGATRAGALGVWGRGAFRRFQARNAFALRADVTTGMLGADYRWHARWVTGLLLARSQGEGSFERNQDSGTIRSNLTGVYPYVFYQGRRAGIWITGGYGWGSARMPTREGDLGVWFGAMGIRGDVLSGLTYYGDVLAAEVDLGQTGSPAEVYRMRWGLEGAVRLGERIQPYIEANVRQDGGSAETGLGMEFGGGVRVRVPAWRLRAEMRSQGVILHTVEGFREWGVSGSVQVGDGPMGAMLMVRPSWGAGHGRGTYHQQTLQDAVPLGPGMHQTEMEFAYGVPLGKGIARPVLGLTRLSQGTLFRLGGELRPGGHLSVSLFGVAHTHTDTPVELGLNLQGALTY